MTTDAGAAVAANGGGDGGAAAAAASAAMSAAASGSNQVATAGIEWLPGVDGETAQFITGKTVKDLPSLAKGYVEAQRALSQPRPFEMPKEGDTEGLKKLHAALGVPETPEKYTFGELGKTLPPEVVKQWAPEFHKLGVSDKQAAGLIASVSAQAAAAQAAQDAAFLKASDEGFEALKLEWGDKFEGNLDLAGRGMRKLSEKLGGLTADQVKGMEKAIGARGVHMLGLIMGEHSVEAGFVFSNGQNVGMSKEGARAELQAMMQDGAIAKALTNRRDPNHQKHLARKIQLEQLAHS